MNLRTWPLRPVLGALFLGTAAGAAPSCTTTDADAAPREVIAHLADDVFVPAHAALHADAVALADALSSCDAADTEAWRTVRADWSVRAAFAFGPVAVQMQAPSLDFWPVRTDNVDKAVASAPATVDAATIDGLGTSAKGLPALEYLLFSPPLSDKSCTFAAALADDVVRRTAELAEAWLAEGEALKTAGDPGSKYDSVQAALDVIVNASIENLFGMVKGKLDRPLGNLTGSDPDPELVESRFSDTSLADLNHNLDGFVRVYLGADMAADGDPGLGTLVAARDPDLDARVLQQLDLARSSLAAIKPSLAAALTADRSAVQTARDEVDTLRRLIKLDVASLLNVTLSLSDNDGD